MDDGPMMVRWGGALRGLGLVLVLVLLVVAWPAEAAAHDFAMSSVHATTRGERVELSFRLDRTSVAELLARSRPVGTPLRLDDLEAGRRGLLRYVEQRLEVTNDQRPCPLRFFALAFDETTGRVRLEAVARCREALGRLAIESALFADDETPHELMLWLSHGAVHHEFMFYQQVHRFEVDVSALAGAEPSPSPASHDAAAPGGGVVVEPPAVASAREPSIRAPAPAPAVAPFVALGLRHILGGWDHVLFVLALVLVATRLRRLAVVITAFTLAHCLALAMATFGVLSISPAIVEPLIAASIVWVVLHDIVMRSTVGPIPAVFGFGLLHGLGFAEVLLGLELPRATMAWALLAFNVGVELGQLAIVGVAFWLLAPVRRYPVAYRRVQLGVGVAIMAWALLWVAERTLGLALVPG